MVASFPHPDHRLLTASKHDHSPNQEVFFFSPSFTVNTPQVVSTRSHLLYILLCIMYKTWVLVLWCTIIYKWSQIENVKLPED